MDGESIASKVEEVDCAEISMGAAEIMANPELLASLQAGLSGLIRFPSDILDTLPVCVKRRVNALKNIQVECALLEGKFYEEAHQLEMKYAEYFEPLYQKRSDIVIGLYEPIGEEAVWNEPGDDEEDDKDETETGEPSNVTSTREKTEEEKIAERIITQLSLDENTKGVPEFWLTAMKNVDIITEMIQKYDEDVLKHLTDIKLIFTGEKEGSVSEDDDGMGFVLEFQFSPNPYFTNSALTKTYRMKSEPDNDEPFAFDGPDIVSCSGCKIDWKTGKDITKKLIKKKQKHKGRGHTRYVTKFVQNESFFNFFDPPEVPESEDDMDEETEALLAADFGIGHFFRERLIPKAVLFFTGEAIEDDSDDDEDETSSEDDDGDGDDDDDDYDEENDPDYKPPEKPDGKPKECEHQ